LATNVLLLRWDTKPAAHQEDVPTPGTDTQNVFLCRESSGGVGLPAGEGGRVVNLHALVASAVNGDGHREIHGLQATRPRTAPTGWASSGT
jgi:hypothetical protein